MSANSLFEVKTGISLAKDEERAVQELFDQIDQPNTEAVIFFCSSEYKLDTLGKALKARFRCCPIGCTTAGEITSAGYQVEVANDGQEAVAKYTKAPDAFDLIFMDIQMPGMDGMEATRVIRNEPSKINGIPIVAMTAHAMKGDREKCLEAGMDDYIPKPIKRELVFKMIEKWVLNKEVS